MVRWVQIREEIVTRSQSAVLSDVHIGSSLGVWIRAKGAILAALSYSTLTSIP